MTLSEMVEEFHELSDERQVAACEGFLKAVLKSNISYLTYTIHDWMISVVDEEDDDFFGTEGMNI